MCRTAKNCTKNNSTIAITMAILFVFLLIMRPDWGIIAVAAWTAISLVVHLARLFQAMIDKARGQAIVSWLA